MALENKLGLTSSADLAREEERISKKKAAELFEKGIAAILWQNDSGVIYGVTYIDHNSKTVFKVLVGGCTGFKATGTELEGGKSCV